MEDAATDPAVDHKALHEAVCLDDVALVESIFAADGVRDYVRATDQTIATALASKRRVFADKSFRPFFVFCPRGVRQRSRLLVGEAARLGAVKVLAWFYAPEQLDIMGAALAHVLARVAKRASSADALEILLTSGAFRDGVGDKSKQTLLQKCLPLARSPAMVSLLVAHGVELSSSLVHACAVKAVHTGGLEAFDAIIDHGPFLVGADLLQNEEVRNVLRHPRLGLTTLRRLLEGGVACGTSIGASLVEAATNVDIGMTELLLKEGFADADARAQDGSTALVNTGRNYTAFVYPSVHDKLTRIVLTLLDYGATVPEETDTMSPSAAEALRYVMRQRQHQATDGVDDNSLPSKPVECGGLAIQSPTSLSLPDHP